MTIFQPTHKLMAPAGEEIPVMLVAKTENRNYLVISEIEYEEGTDPFYQWHPDQGVTYAGMQLKGLDILPLNPKNYHHNFSQNKSEKKIAIT